MIHTQHRNTVAWKNYISKLDQGINCVCCNGFPYRFYILDVHNIIYGVDDIYNGLRPSYTIDTIDPEEFRQCLNDIFKSRYYFGKCVYEAISYALIASDIKNVRKLPNSDLAEVLFI